MTMGWQTERDGRVPSKMFSVILFYSNVPTKNQPVCLVQDAFQVWQRVSVIEVGEAVRPHHCINFFLGSALTVRVEKHG